jgi:hypothetical protein
MASVWGNVSDWRAPVWKICKKSDGVLHSFWKFRNFPPPLPHSCWPIPIPPPRHSCPPLVVSAHLPPHSSPPPPSCYQLPLVTVYYCCTRLRYCCIRCGHGIRGRMRARAVGMARGAMQHRGKPPRTLTLSYSRTLTLSHSHP